MEIINLEGQHYHIHILAVFTAMFFMCIGIAICLNKLLEYYKKKANRTRRLLGTIEDFEEQVRDLTIELTEQKKTIRNFERKVKWINKTNQGAHEYFNTEIAKLKSMIPQKKSK